MESTEYHQALDQLRWQIELGADEAICDAPVDRFALADKPVKPAAQTVAPAPSEPVNDSVDVVAEAEQAAAAAGSLEDLRSALAAFEHCALKRGARNLVFCDGKAGAPVMIVGEAPGRDEDREGRPFVGRAGQLLDRMLDAIGMGRASEDAPVYITNVLPWRPPQNRDPSSDEIAMMRPFVLRHIALAKPQAVVIMGNISAQALLGKRGITRLRGTWTEVAGLPALPMFHPAYLLRSPEKKREAWADLLSLKARVSSG